MKKLIVVVFIALLSVLVVSADSVDDQGNPNDPTENDRANACYEGGSMDGKCDTDWEWSCGWHLIRFENNLVEREDFLAGCITILPPVFVPEVEVEVEVEAAFLFPGIGCTANAAGPSYTDFGGGNFVGVGHNGYGDNTCTGGVARAFALAYAPEGPAAAALICQANGFASASPDFADIYMCNP